MAKREWKNRILGQAPGSDDYKPRYHLVKPDGTVVAENVCLDLSNPVIEEGTPVNALTMNDLEERMENTGKQFAAIFDTPGTHTWSIPEWVQEKGKVDVFIMGGGGSGGCAGASLTASFQDTYIAIASGGASGYVKKLSDYDLQGKTEISVIVGDGGGYSDLSQNGVSLYYGSAINRSGERGSASSFDDQTARGGEGGNAYTGDALASAGRRKTIVLGASGSAGSAAMGINRENSYSGSAGRDGDHLASPDLTNSTTPLSVSTGGRGQGAYVFNHNTGQCYGSAGGGCGALISYDGSYANITESVTTAIETGIGGAALFGELNENIMGNPGEGYGCGGGAVIAKGKDLRVDMRMLGGKGAPGVVIVYA